MPHRPKFNEPWMDELDGHDCVKKSVTLGVKAAMVGKSCFLDDPALALYFSRAVVQNSLYTYIGFAFGE